MEAVDLARQPFAAEDGFEGLLAQEFDGAGGALEEAVVSGDLQEAGDEAGGGGIGGGEGRDFAGGEPFDLLEEFVDAGAELAGLGAFGAEKPAALALAGGVFLRGDVRFHGGRGGGVGQGREGERRGGRGGRVGGFAVGAFLLPPIGIAELPDGVFRIGGRIGSEGVLEDGIETEGGGRGSGFDGDEVEGALGAGHGDVEEAEFLERLALAVFGELRGEDGFGTDDFRLGGGQDPVDGRIWVGDILLVDQQRALAFGGDAVYAQGGQDDEVVFEALGLVHGEDLDVGAALLRRDLLGLDEGDEPQRGAVRLAIEFGGNGRERAQAALFEGRGGKIEFGGEAGGEAGIALFADEAAPAGEVGGRERDFCRERRHREMAAGEGVAGMLDEFGERQDGGDQGVVEQQGIAGPDRADAFFRQGVDQGEALVVAAREEGDGKAVEIGDGLVQFFDEIGRAGEGRGAFLVLLAFGQDVEGDVAGKGFVLFGWFMRLPFGGPLRGDCGPIGLELLGAGQRHGGQLPEDAVDGVEDDGAGAPGLDQRRGDFDGDVAGAVVLGEDAAENARIAAAPFIDRLLGVANVEQGAVAVGVLDDLVDEILDDGPLDEGGVLEFVEEPMEEAGVEAAVEPGAEMGGGRAGGGGEELGDVVEGKLAGADDVVAVLAAIGGEQSVESLGADDLAGEGRVADKGEDGR